MRAHLLRASSLALTLVVLSAAGHAAPDDQGGAARSPDGAAPCPPEDPFRLRPFKMEADDGHWLGDGVAYGPHRDGQRPGGPSPSREEIRQDLRLIAGHWRLLRLYGAEGPAETVLDVIRRDGLDLRVMLGVWIAPEGDAGAAAANRRELDAAVRLAAAYPEIVAAICVGNETQVAWSDHRVPAATLIGHVRAARARAAVPVTVADDLKYWTRPESRAVAAEIDFITLHAHPLWNGIVLDQALAWLGGIVAETRALHPDRPVVLGETGWATAMRHEGEQGRLIKGRTGEPEQATFYGDVTAWARRQRLPLFFFEAFDENWKGGDHPDEVEKHWGLYRSDRTGKEAVADGS